MNFDKLLNDSVFVINHEGQRNGPYKTTISKGKATVFDKTIDVEEGFKLIRSLPNGKEESYTILESNYSPGLGSIPPHYSLILRKDSSLLQKERSVNPTNISISNVSGKVNINSVDSSINETTINIGTTFNQIRDTINAADIDTPEKESLIEKLADLETSINTSGYATKYKEFIQLAANHMTIIAPFIPALTNLLK